MHDYFDIVGVSRGAGGPEIRQACRRKPAPCHPDYGGGDMAGPVAPALVAEGDAIDPDDADVAVDFASMLPIVLRMRDSFFASPS